MDIGGGHNLVLTTTFVRNDPDRRQPSGGARTMLEFFVDGDAAVEREIRRADGRRVPRPPAPGLAPDFDALHMALIETGRQHVLVTAG